jgi:putative SOS response-associated peptidase YedK
MKDGEPFAMAGLWERWIGPGKSGQPETIDSCSLITTDANALMATFHDRMPVIVPRDSFTTWLTGTADEAAPLMHPYAPSALRAWRVSALVNAVRNESPECLAPTP